MANPLPIILEAQAWLNATYDGTTGYQHVDTGYPGSAMSYALVSALQIELNKLLVADNRPALSNITGVFGNETFAACDRYPLILDNTGNRVKILKYGLYSKGYNPKGNKDDDDFGDFNSNTDAAIVNVQTDAGLSDGQISHTANGREMKAVLGVDEYKKVGKGDSKVREIQQYINQNYLSYTGLSACDGLPGRSTVTALIYALQAEEGISVSASTGTMGPSTRKCLPTIPYTGVEKNYSNQTYSAASITKFIKIAQFAMYCMGYDRYSTSIFNSNKYNSGDFNGEFNTQTKNALHAFQADYGLEQRDKINLNEWMAFLLSTGNPGRDAIACDCATRLTPDKLTALRNDGYNTVGRYLSGDIVINNTRVAKNLLRTEMKDIFDANFNLFVIFQDSREYYRTYKDENGNLPTSIFNYFNEERGYNDAEKAFAVARTLGVPKGEVIYFAVDYDFTESSIKSRVVPHFKGIKKYADSINNIYRIGIYGSRNTCNLVKKEGYSVSSFSADMSTGFSGNMGFPIPDDWAFSQISSYTLSGFGIDKDAASGKYTGFTHFELESDNEYDLMNSNGTVYMVTNSSGASDDTIPTYWSKVKNKDGSFSLKYQMFDGISNGAFFSMKNNVASNDKYQYVYFRDVGGALNGGYIDTNLIHDYVVNPNGTFVCDLFSLVQITRDTNNYVSGIFTLPPPPDEYYPIEFLVTKSTKAYIQRFDPNIVTTSYISPGTKVKILALSQAGASYPQAIRALEYTNPSGEWLYFINPTEGIAFVDLDFENGVMPINRNLITAIG